MRWWKRPWRSSVEAPGNPSQCVRLTLPGWNEETPIEDLRVWRDIDGDVILLHVSKEAIAPVGADPSELRFWCRNYAAGRGGGLIEVRAVDGGTGASVIFIYKRLQMPAYVYTGILITSARGTWLLWTIVAGEHGTTGVREALVTADLMSAGKLTIDDYRLFWAQDPYDPAYRGVDRSVLRFMSDDDSYDKQFPQHPLSKVRRLLAILPDKVQVDSERF
jgi:hypothetical protein